MERFWQANFGPVSHSISITFTVHLTERFCAILWTCKRPKELHANFSKGRAWIVLCPEFDLWWRSLASFWVVLIDSLHRTYQKWWARKSEDISNCRRYFWASRTNANEMFTNCRRWVWDSFSLVLSLLSSFFLSLCFIF